VKIRQSVQQTKGDKYPDISGMPVYILTK
jgi:hypothetical protein